MGSAFRDVLGPVAGGLRFGRRSLLAGVGAAATGWLGYRLLRPYFKDPAPVFIARGQRYDGPLERTIRDGLLATGIDPAKLAGRKVLLKPNLVEPVRTSPHMTTHPAMVLATAEVFRRWGATVVVGEAPGHVRDTEMALSESRLGPALRDAKLPFADLNYEEVRWAPNRGKASKLDGLYFPRSVFEADLIVSMPKLKTHHWMGCTVSLKNMYGVLPGVAYGWPKNVLHHAGIPQTVFDINASLPKMIAVVDGVVCMEGDGPIMGSPKPLGIVAVGLQPAAVDATCRGSWGWRPNASATCNWPTAPWDRSPTRPSCNGASRGGRSLRHFRFSTCPTCNVCAVPKPASMSLEALSADASKRNEPHGHIGTRAGPASRSRTARRADRVPRGRAARSRRDWRVCPA